MVNFGNALSNLDFDAPGKSNGFIDVNHPDNDHAFGSIRVPVGLINGRDGPTILLTAGNHGDEYEGQIILNHLMQQLTPDQATGRIVMLPALNTPAVLDRARIQPLDQGNMNRFFPGNEDAGPTQSISGFVTTHLIPISDIIMDFHSVGTSAEYANCGFHCRGDNETLNATNLDLVGTFSAPFTIVCPLEGYSGDFDSAAYAQGTPFLSYELGGMGRVSNETLKISWKGCLKVLNRAGLIGDDVLDAQTNNELDRPTRFVDLGEGCHHITASTYGVADQHLERCHRL